MNELIIRLNELIIRLKELLTRLNESKIRLNELIIRLNELLIRLNELIIRLNELIICSNKIINSFKRNKCCMRGVRVRRANGAGACRPCSFHNITSDKALGVDSPDGQICSVTLVRSAEGVKGKGLMKQVRVGPALFTTERAISIGSKQP